MGLQPPKSWDYRPKKSWDYHPKKSWDYRPKKSRKYHPEQNQHGRAQAVRERSIGSTAVYAIANVPASLNGAYAA
jgi:hypothetical protein